ncbi:MAG: hypothetical protein K0R05_4034 [Anaerocolumna sp.]|jgi:predicted acetyltransferase|nr:hypothetical protein [Anaerocolumna sp.]
MKIDVILSNEETSYIIKNMYPLYLHDLAEIHGILPNQHGIFEDDETRTLAEQYDIQNIWFENPKELFPYYVTVDGIPAGFCLIASGKYVLKEVDYYVNETFILRPFRNKGISQEAVIRVLDKHRGRWMLDTSSEDINSHAQLFWSGIILAYTGGIYQIEKRVVHDMPRLVFKFHNQ